MSYTDFFFSNLFLQKVLLGIPIIRVSNSLDPDQARQNVGPQIWVQTDCKEIISR